MKEGKKIILCPNPSRDRDMTATKFAQSILHGSGFRTVVCSPFKDQREGTFANLEVHPLTQELRSADLMITFGGDGTILHLAKLAALNKVPVLGVNTGSLGFIAELELGELETLRRLETWDFEMESRMMLDVSVLRDGRPIYTNLGLNDAVIREGPISHAVRIGDRADPDRDDVRVDGVPLGKKENKTYILLNKPRGYVSTLSDEKGRPTVAELVRDVGTRVFPVGRLDMKIFSG